MKTPLVRILSLSGLAVLIATPLAACNTGSDAGVSVVASFYPLQFVAEQVGKDHIDVTNLTSPGAEPHDLELDPQQVADVTDADLVVYLSQFQPAVDDAVKAQASDTSLDVSSATKFKHKEAADEHADDSDADHGQRDPHVWLDPTKLSQITDAVTKRLIQVDESNADEYKSNAADLIDRLSSLDDSFSKKLSQCDRHEIVTSHAAFGYLADRYGLEQVSVSGLAPDSEPKSAAIKEVADYVDEHSVTTIFYETLVEPDVAETIASETGAKTAVLDPIEGLKKGSKDNYIDVMNENLTTLEGALGCQA